MLSGENNWLWRVGFGLLLIGIGAGVFFWLSQTSLLAIDTIEVEGNNVIPTETVLDMTTPILKGESIFNPSLDSAASELEDLPFVETVEFDRVFPNTLRILVREHHPAVNLASTGGQTYLVSRSGVVLLELESLDQSLPYLTTITVCEAEVGSVPECQDALVGLQFVNDIPVNFNHEFSEISVEEGVIKAVTRGGVHVHFGTLEQYGLKFEVLRQLLARSTASGVLVTIDVSVPERPVTRQGEEAALPEAASAGAGGAGQDDGDASEADPLEGDAADGQ